MCVSVAEVREAKLKKGNQETDSRKEVRGRDSSRDEQDKGEAFFS